MDLPPRMPPPASPNGGMTQTVSQNLLGNVAGFGAMGLANGGVAAATTSAGLGTAEAPIVAQVQGFFAGRIKHHPHWDEQNWTEPFMVIIGIPIAFFFVHNGVDVVSGLVKAIIISILGTKIALVEYDAVKKTVASGIAKPVAPENEYANNAHPWPAPSSPGWGMTQVTSEPTPVSVGDVLP